MSHSSWEPCIKHHLYATNLRRNPLPSHCGWRKTCSDGLCVAPHHGCCHSQWVIISIATFFCVCVQKLFCVRLQGIPYSYTMIIQRDDEFEEHDVSHRVEQREGLLHNTLIDWMPRAKRTLPVDAKIAAATVWHIWSGEGGRPGCSVGELGRGMDKH